MKIGVIVHSHTGSTYKAAMALREGLEAAGHAVTPPHPHRR
jgi:flavodoxin